MKLAVVIGYSDARQTVIAGRGVCRHADSSDRLVSVRDDDIRNGAPGGNPRHRRPHPAQHGLLAALGHDQSRAGGGEDDRHDDDDAADDHGVGPLARAPGGGLRLGLAVLVAHVRSFASPKRNRSRL